MLRQMVFRLSDAVVPRPPVLQKALAERHVYTSWTGHELVYMIASTCPNPDEVQVAINRRRLHSLVTTCEVVITVAAITAFIVVGSVATHIFVVS